MRMYEPIFLIPFSCSNEDGVPDVMHCVIYHPTDRGYGFTPDGAVFISVDELIFKHAHTSIRMYFSHIDTCLSYPVFLERARGNNCEQV